jgi:prepilin-type N-terminal cleavage/methylation domain-containing protein
MNVISYRTSRECKSYFCAPRRSLLRRVCAPGNARGNFQHPPGLSVCAILCILSGVMNKQLENEKAQMQPAAFPARKQSLGSSIMNTRTSGKSGFTLLEIMIVVSLIALLAVIAIPNFVRARVVSNQTTCINNLRQIRAAVAQWALEKNAAVTSPVQYSDIRDALRGSVVCPSGGTSFSDSYLIIDPQTPPTCKNAPTGPSAHCLPADSSQ